MFSKNDLDQDMKFVYLSRKINFDKNLQIKTYCDHPFRTVNVDKQGRVFVCGCQAWLPISVGNILDFNSFEEILSSPRAVEIQNSILDGSYRYCDYRGCDYENRLKNVEFLNDLTGDNIPTKYPVKLVMGIDDSCNLTCPSCRSDFRFIKEGEEFDRRMKISDHLADLVSKFKGNIQFEVSGDGDPFASLIYRNFLSKVNFNHKHLTLLNSYRRFIDESTKFNELCKDINLKDFVDLSDKYKEVINFEKLWDEFGKSVWVNIDTWNAFKGEDWKDSPPKTMEEFINLPVWLIKEIENKNNFVSLPSWVVRDFGTMGNFIKTKVKNIQVQFNKVITNWSSLESYFIINTNGILIKDYWSIIESKISHLNSIKISLDAGTEEVYNKTRRLGSWNRVIDNLKWLVQLKKDNNYQFNIITNFVVQAENVNDIETYCDLVSSIGVDEINYQKVTDWSTWKNFSDHAVWQETHPDFPIMVKQLKVVSQHPKVLITNLEPFIK